MKTRVFLDTVCIIRLFGQNLMKKVLKNIEIYVTPAVIREITSKRKNALVKMIDEGKIRLVDVGSDSFENNMVKLIRDHKGKEQAINYSKKRYSHLHDLGEFEIMAYVKEYPNDGFKIVTFDKKATMMMKRELRIRHAVVDDKKEQQMLFGLSDLEINMLWRGYE